MKKYVMLAATLLTGTAVAQTATVAPPAPAVAPTPTTPMASTARDRVTTRAEAVEVVRKHFAEIDANKDQYISRDEFTKAREDRVERRIEKREARKNSPKEGRDVRRHVMRMNGPGGFGGGMLAMADTNKDGQVTQAEAETLALQHFDRMDSNKDGQITPEERRAGRQIMIQQRREEKKSGS